MPPDQSPITRQVGLKSQGLAAAAMADPATGATTRRTSSAYTGSANCRPQCGSMGPAMTRPSAAGSSFCDPRSTTMDSNRYKLAAALWSDPAEPVAQRGSTGTAGGVSCC
jgi:hypothetical protein